MSASESTTRPAASTFGADVATTPELYRSLVDVLDEGIVVQHAATNTILAANPAAERILGISIEQLRGRSSHDRMWRAINEDGSDCPGEQHPAVLTARTGRPIRNRVLGMEF